MRLGKKYPLGGFFVAILLAPCLTWPQITHVSSQTDIESTLRAMATCSLYIRKSFDTVDILTAETRLIERRGERRPTLQASTRFGKQSAESESTEWRSVGVDGSIPLVDLVTGRSITAEKRNVDLESLRFQNRAFETTMEAIDSSIEILVQEQELEVLRNEYDELAVLVKSLTAAGKIGVGESSSALLSNASLVQNAKLIKVKEFELLKIRRDFVIRFGYPAPALPPRLEEGLSPGLPVIHASSTIKELDAEALGVEAEISAEKSYLLPRMSLTAAFNSDQGYYPQDTYTVGVQLDLSGLFRSSEIREKLSAKKHTALFRREMELKRLKNENRMEELELKSINEQIELLNKAVTLAIKANRVSLHKLTSGRIPFTEYMQVQDVLRELKRDLIGTRAQHLRLTMGRFNKMVFADPDTSNPPGCPLITSDL